MFGIFRYLVFLTTAALVTLLFLWPVATMAEPTLTASPTNIVAAASQPITLYVHTSEPDMGVSLSTSSDILTLSSNYVQTNNAGDASVTLYASKWLNATQLAYVYASDADGTQSIIIPVLMSSQPCLCPPPGTLAPGHSSSVTPPISSARASTKTTGVSASPPSLPGPASPNLTGVLIDKKSVNLSKPIILSYGHQPTLSGTAVAGGTVHLYIFSKMKQATVIADSNGKWSYDLPRLPIGPHHVEAEVTDPITQKTSPRMTLVSMNIRGKQIHDQALSFKGWLTERVAAIMVCAVFLVNMLLPRRVFGLPYPQLKLRKLTSVARALVRK